MEPYRLLIIASDDGTRLQAILDACADGTLPAQAFALITDKRCPALTLAEKSDMAIVFHPWGEYRKMGRLKSTYDLDLAVRVNLRHPDLLVVTGWSRPLSGHFYTNLGVDSIGLRQSTEGEYIAEELTPGELVARIRQTLTE